MWLLFCVVGLFERLHRRAREPGSAVERDGVVQARLQRYARPGGESLGSPAHGLHLGRARGLLQFLSAPLAARMSFVHHWGQSLKLTCRFCFSRCFSGS